MFKNQTWFFSRQHSNFTAFISLEIDELAGTGAVPLIHVEQLRWQEVIKMRLRTLFTGVRSV